MRPEATEMKVTENSPTAADPAPAEAAATSAGEEKKEDGGMFGSITGGFSSLTDSMPKMPMPDIPGMPFGAGAEGEGAGAEGEDGEEKKKDGGMFGSITG